ncbi:SRPBCC domain-containing protein [Actinomadura sp. NEAU-AAG7]|uniref:SRPBCC family protein n=1 Tax=Actinomadura sp. NEAU-AAG7 TaxID=2839640 RepID=UPI001BE42F7A|nr:SRPBCC domain-containing protein [Actinomadura sp. NEAU-AAG7]MBT2212151.1 SRPBCC domain-containing protein [Actinomadura sp. NEAU-AAG7]
MAEGIVIDEASNTVRIRRTYTAGVDRVWWAWTDAEAISRWWGPQGWATTVYEMDVRPGGRWRFQIAPEDRSADPVRSVASYQVVDARAELRYDAAFADQGWRPDDTGTFPTAVAFASTGTGCAVEVAASFPDGHALRRAVELQMAEGYAEALGRLADLLDDIDGDHAGAPTTKE